MADWLEFGISAERTTRLGVLATHFVDNKKGAAMLKSVWSLLLCAGFLMSSAVTLRAQSTTAQVSGMVTDETGAIVPGVQVAVTNTATGISRTVATDDKGRYVAAQLAPGPYQISASLTGFETMIRKGVTLEVGQDLTLNISMKVGTVSEQVTVTEEAP